MQNQALKKELLLHSKLLVKDLKSKSPNLAQLAKNFERINENKSITAWSREDLDQDIYVNYMMAVNLYDFEINDFIKIVYWLLKSNYLILTPVIIKLDKALKEESEKISTQS